jgi:hypothetical protein
VSSGYRTRLPAKVGSHVPSRVQQHWILPPNRGGLQSCHMSSGTGSFLPAEVGFNVATCPLALDLCGGLKILPLCWEGSKLSRVPWSPVSRGLQT